MNLSTRMLATIATGPHVNIMKHSKGNIDLRMDHSLSLDCSQFNFHNFHHFDLTISAYESIFEDLVEMKVHFIGLKDLELLYFPFELV